MLHGDIPEAKEGDFNKESIFCDVGSGWGQTHPGVPRAPSGAQYKWTEHLHWINDIGFFSRVN